jgi:hypothetical protein
LAFILKLALHSIAIGTQNIMPLDPIQFFKACNPGKTLVLANETDRRLYIDFTTARSSKTNAASLTHELFRTITRSDDRRPPLHRTHRLWQIHRTA